MCKTKLQIARDGALREFLFHLSGFSGKDACWEWRKYRDAKGYGVICFDLMKFPVHRLSFEHFKGLIPRGMLVMHTCDNPPCFNYHHLFLGSHADNMLDMALKGRAGKPKESVPMSEEEVIFQLSILGYKVTFDGIVLWPKRDRISVEKWLQQRQGGLRGRPAQRPYFLERHNMRLLTEAR